MSGIGGHVRRNAHQVVMLFVGAGPEGMDLVSFASPLIVLVAVFVLFDSVRMVIGYALNGLSDMKMPTAIIGLRRMGKQGWRDTNSPRAKCYAAPERG
uniref:Uncharacterized protein n=1 Tax=Candidatus Kentrum sp. LPFa TaxID=2126335 RepID=A0A450Y6V1_9GAMM|nr:MAG: hypothetical protein BECKLPF1236A_GA0070988_1018110 [Candidatus Kentron sp. LPFa]VFK37245.1 MAG: hypothetical protein BECKLPF1236C_GA0070990_108021 [Candidatus Kentron sp. LPFa]